MAQIVQFDICGRIDLRPAEHFILFCIYMLDLFYVCITKMINKVIHLQQ